jgi:hypothetical protein
MRISDPDPRLATLHSRANADGCRPRQGQYRLRLSLPLTVWPLRLSTREAAGLLACRYSILASPADLQHGKAVARVSQRLTSSTLRPTGLFSSIAHAVWYEVEPDAGDGVH